VLQVLLNIDRSFSHELYVQIYDFESDDHVLNELKTVVNQIRTALTDEEGKKSDSEAVDAQGILKAMASQYKESLEL
jgi:hypothetical protein